MLLAIPVETTRVVIEQTVAGRETQRTEVDRNVLYVLPDTLKIDASADPSYRAGRVSTRRRCTPAHVQIVGEFVNRDFAQLLRRQKEGREVKWDEARLLVLNSESRALRAVDDLAVAGETPAVAADGYAGSAGIRRAVPRAALRESAIDSVPREAHARRQQPAHVSCRWRARRTSRSSPRGRIRSSKARRRRSIR